MMCKTLCIVRCHDCNELYNAFEGHTCSGKIPIATIKSIKPSGIYHKNEVKE